MEPSETFCVRKNLDEVSFVRPILILLVVLYHSMAIHTGNWEMPNGVTVILAYKAIGRLSYAFMLEAFVFVSGYVWAYQREKGGSESLIKLLHKKCLRLFIPTVVFGIVYLLLFERNNFTLIHLLEGPGHLWFLPMLFECFIISWCILHFNLSLRVLLPFLFLIALFIPSDLPFRMSYTFYYLPFFLLGFYYYGLYDQLKAKLKLNHVFELWMLFLVVYLGMVYCRSYIIDNVHSPIMLGGVKNSV